MLQKINYFDYFISSNVRRTKRKAVADKSRLWPSAVVVYNISSSFSKCSGLYLFGH